MSAPKALCLGMASVRCTTCALFLGLALRSSPPLQLSKSMLQPLQWPLKFSPGYVCITQTFCMLHEPWLLAASALCDSVILGICALLVLW